LNIKNKEIRGPSWIYEDAVTIKNNRTPQSSTSAQILRRGRLATQAFPEQANKPGEPHLAGKLRFELTAVVTEPAALTTRTRSYP